MSRKKQYIEAEVLDKAMRLFWRNGYENTSMQMLEKEMGINKFSIYSSFGSKHGVFLKSLESYNQKTRSMFNKLKQGEGGIEDIKTFFYDSVDVCYVDGNIPIVEMITYGPCALRRHALCFSASGGESCQAIILGEQMTTLCLSRLPSPSHLQTISHLASLLTSATRGDKGPAQG